MDQIIRKLFLTSITITSVLAWTGCKRSPHVTDELVAQRLSVETTVVKRIHRQLGVSNSMLLGATPEQVQEALIESRYPDLPSAREKFRFWQLRSETGQIPLQVRTTSLQDFLGKATRLTQQGKCSLAYLPINCVSGWTAGLNKDHSGWSFLGPSTVGGRTRAIAINPHNDQDIWVGSVAGGLWHSQDGGRSLGVVDDLLPSLVISSIVIDPKDPSTVYAGTGEGFFNLDSLRGAGILTTRHGGPWSQLASTIPADDASPFLFINRLAISPDGSALLAATWKGIYLSVDAAHGTWTKQFDGDIADLEFNPKDGRYAIAGGRDTGESYHSEDGGRSWNKAQHEGTWIHISADKSTNPSRVEVTYASSNPSIVYASVDNNSGEIWRSPDGGKSFLLMASETPEGDLAYYLGDQGWYDNAVWAGSTDPDFVVVGGVNLWKSSDGGKTLRAISDWEQEKSIHADHHAIVSDPGKENAVFFGNDGGFYKTDNINTAGTDATKTQGWIRLNNNYGVTQFYDVAWNQSSGVLIGGSQDNGTLSLKGGGQPKDWTEEFPGDGGYCASDLNSTTIYGEYVYLSLHRNTGGDKPAEFINGEYTDSMNRTYWKQDKSLIIMDSYNSTANFIAPLLDDPNDPSQNTILAGGASLWRTKDAKTDNSPTSGPHWSVIKPAVPGWNDMNNNNIPDYISAIMVRKGMPNTIWVGYNRGEVYMSTNANEQNPAWKLLPNKGIERRPSRLVTKILADPGDAKVFYLTYGGYSDKGAHDNVWKTVNGGLTWANISKTLTASPVFSITTHPTNHNYLYLGNERGIFASEDGGAHWSVSNEGPMNTAVEGFTWDGEKLMAATHGRGIWMIDLSTPKVPSRGITAPR